ncbi:AraC family transcriptional regulator [Variovorax sp. YR216]|uniref:AraC family transcriptional regulator n=1 Tax=Variovorax sp. YR216 TaxID=1882828 RepID=UPI000B80DA1E|nr:AraC family transcriptional regulator [Variovorax sp. YR216]
MSFEPAECPPLSSIAEPAAAPLDLNLPLVHPAYLRLLVTAAAAEGIDLGPCLAPLGLEASQLQRSDVPMSLAVWRSVMLSLDRMASRPGLPMRLGRQVPLLSHGPLAYLMVSSADLRQALEGLVRFAPLRLAVLNLRLRARGQHVELHVRPLVSLGDVERFTLEFLLAMLCKSIRDLCGGASRAMKLHLPGSMARGTRIWAEQGVSVAKSAGWPYFSFPGSLAAMALPTASGPDRLLAWQACEEAERHRGWSPSISSRIEQLFRTGPSTNYKLEQVAEQLGMSRRTIARRLSAEHTSFSELVDASRRQRLLRRLADRRSNPIGHSLTLAEIAEDLGYADGAVLGRAVQRWFGISPSDLQRWVDAGLALPGETSTSVSPKAKTLAPEVVGRRPSRL